MAEINCDHKEAPSDPWNLRSGKYDILLGDAPYKPARDGRDGSCGSHRDPGDHSRGGRYRPSPGPCASVFDLGPTICEPCSKTLTFLWFVPAPASLTRMVTW